MHAWNEKREEFYRSKFPHMDVNVGIVFQSSTGQRIAKTLKLYDMRFRNGEIERE